MTDYRHPPDWEAMTDEERCAWYTRERCRRQAMRQDTRTARLLRKQYERLHRKLDAHPDTVDVRAHR